MPEKELTELKEMNSNSMTEIKKMIVEMNSKTEEEIVDMCQGLLPARMERCVVPGSWSEAYKAINEVEVEVIPAPSKMERTVVPGSWSEIYRAIREGTFLPDYEETVLPDYDEALIKNDPWPFAVVKDQWTKDTLAKIDICVCGECKQCWPLETCDGKNLIKYIKLYGIDAYLFKVYGNNKLKSIMMEGDDIYEAQQVFIQTEFFYC